MSIDESPAGLAAVYFEVGRQLTAHSRAADALNAITHTAVTYVPGAECAGITRYRPEKLETVVPTDSLVERVDRIQYELGTGPCVDAVLEDAVFRTGDLRADLRWPEFGRRAASETGVQSMLAIRLFLEDQDYIAGLNLYSTSVDAFDDTAQMLATVLGTHAALAVSAAASRERAANLEKALISNREIGVAMGVLMHQHKITRENAFGLLRLASQNGNRKLADVASEVADTGSLTLPTSLPSRRAPSVAHLAAESN